MSACFRTKFKRSCAALLFLGVVSIVSSVKAAGLPGEFTITDRWRHVYSMYSGVTNPSFINEENYMSVRFMLANTLQEFYTHEFGVTVPIGLHSAAGISWMMQGASSYEIMDPDGNPSGGTISDQNHFVALTYANNIWNRLTIGGNLSIIAQNVANIDNTVPNAEMRLGFGFDLGLSYKLLRHPMIGNHILGLSTQNLFTHILDTDETYARAVRTSLLSDFWERRISFGADFVLKDLISAEDVWSVDSAKQLPWEFTQKLGFNILRIFKVYMLTGWDPEGFDHYGFAFGLNMPGFLNGRDLEGLMQFVSVNNKESSTNVSHMTFYARAEFGRHREEIYARNMARRGTLGPNNLYNQALELFHRGECYRAYWIFSQIAVEYPDFFRNDMVNLYQAACHECLDLRKSAETIYNRVKDDHSRSIVVPMADLGLMRVYYRNNDFSRVEAQFEELNSLGVPDSIKYHAYYIMGQAAMKRSDFTRARQLFTMIPDNHPDYVFAYHSAAVTNMLNDNIQGAIADLEYVIQLKPQNKAQEEIINRSYVFLGYLYYEDLTTEGAMAKAVTALRTVPRGSYYYQDALLGLGWTALKARQWVDCISAGSELARSTQDPILQSEGSLIQAYAHAMQRNYVPAVSLLEDAVKKLASYNIPSPSELAQKQNEYNSNRLDYEQIGLRIDELGQARQSSLIQTSIDSIAAPQTRTKGAIDQYFKFTDEFQRGSFFARSLEQVKEDVDYALARFSRYKGASGIQRQLERTTGESDAIDEELEKLRRELEGE
ncbi:MAG: hypothetical protein LBI42_04330 [Chitinispirillales bacterium]|jgi:tetratricopeptide (TPR) repeat protein|nr:hypothetical protein [Chitinispirillales bacterium]